MKHTDIPASTLAYRLKQEIEQYEKRLLHGGAVSFEEYKHLTGVVRGLTLAMDQLEALADQMDQDNE